MNCLVLGNTDQVAVLQQMAPTINWQTVVTIGEARSAKADAFFYLKDDAATHSWEGFSFPVLVNCAISVLPTNGATDWVGINGWPFFLQKAQWEISGHISPAVQALLQVLGKTAMPAPAGPGLISARVIAMVINEAYFALGDAVSTKTDIDTAMKLGTNYPYGPFEWAEILGIRQVYQLLDTLAQTDERCTPAPLLKTEAMA